MPVQRRARSRAGACLEKGPARRCKWPAAAPPVVRRWRSQAARSDRDERALNSTDTTMTAITASCASVVCMEG